MSDEDFMYHEANNGSYKRIVNLDGVRTTVCENRFEIMLSPQSEVSEQVAVQMLRDWVRWRKQQEELRVAGSVPR